MESLGAVWALSRVNHRELIDQLSKSVQKLVIVIVLALVVRTESFSLELGQPGKHHSQHRTLFEEESSVICGDSFSFEYIDEVLNFCFALKKKLASETLVYDDSD